MTKRKLQRLSAKQVLSKLTAGMHPDGNGLYLQVASGLTKSWVLRYKRAGKSRYMGLGSCELFSLAEARTRAQDARRLLADGIDPLSERKASRAAHALETAKSRAFDDCAAAYIKAHRAGWKNPKHVEQWENTLATYVTPIFGRLSIADIDTGLVLRALEPIWKEKNETATRLRGRIQRIIDWATTRGYRKGENPARWRGHLEHNLPNISRRQRTRHYPALPFGELPKFMAALRKQEGEAARALEYLILNASRTNEIITAEPAEVDLKSAVWVAPAEHMKRERDHRAPLSQAALAIVRERLGPDRPHLFAGRGVGEPLSNGAMAAVVRQMCKERNWIDPTSGRRITVHGFRSSFRDWAAERTSYPSEVCEMALAHAVSDAVEAAYRRGDLFEKRRRLMTEWARFCEQRHAGEVVSLRAKG